MIKVSAYLRTRVIACCTAASLAGLAGAAAPAHAYPSATTGMSQPAAGVSLAQLTGSGVRRLPPGRHYAPRAGLYTCGATNDGTHLNRRACGGGDKMRTYGR